MLWYVLDTSTYAFLHPGPYSILSCCLSFYLQHIAGYVGLSRVYTYSNFFVPINELHRLLTPEEIQRIEAIDMNNHESAYREIITWCMEEVATFADEEMVSGFVASKYRELILKEQDSFAELFDDDDQPISFAYYQFICFLSAVYMPLFAMAAALDAGIGEAAYWLTDILAGLIVLLQAIFVVGLRVLAENMSDPFGSDVGNLSVLHYITFTWETSVQILLAKKPPPLDKNTEEKLCLERPPLEKPWDDDDKNARSRSAHCSVSGFEVEPPQSESLSMSTAPSSYDQDESPNRWSVSGSAEKERKSKKKERKSRKKRNEQSSLVAAYDMNSVVAPNAKG